MSTNAKAEAARGQRGPTPAQRRNIRKRSEKAYAQIGSIIREKVASYFMRRNRLTRIQRQILAFIEGRWTPKKHSQQDEQARRALRMPAMLIMEANRFQGSKTEGKRQRSIEQFLTSLFKPAKAAP